MSMQKKRHSLDERGCMEKGNEAEAAFILWADYNKMSNKPGTEKDDIREFIDRFVIKDGKEISVQVKSRGNTPLYMFCMEVKGTNHGGWLWESKADYLVFVDDYHIHMVKMEEAREFVSKNIDLESPPSNQKNNALCLKKRYKRESSKGVSHLVYIASEDLESFESYRRYDRVE